MDETTEKMRQKKFAVYEWTIENFRSWAFSGVLRSLEPRSNAVQFELIRTSHTDKRKEKLWLNITNVPGNAKGDFSLIGPDRLIIWTKRVNKKDIRNNLHIGVLPVNFSDLVALIRKNEAVHGDRLTLRFRFEDEKGNVFHSTHSMFEGRTMSVKISLASILNGQPEPSALRRVFTAEYPLSGGTTEKVKVIVNESPSSKIELMLVSDSSNETISFRTRMSVLHSDGSVIRIEDREEEVSKGQIWTFSDSLTKNEVVLEGLSILLRLTVFPSTELKQLYTLIHHSPFVTEVTTTKSPNEPVDVLLKDFLSLHQNKDFSDLQLTSEGVSFPVHKSILSARSPVFKSMLSSSDMKEVDIADLDAPTLARFLTFLYSGTVNDLQSDVALKLYHAANEYQVPTLKTACVSFLSAVLSTNDVCDVLSLADKQGDERLLSATHSFILKNYNKVLESEEWESLMKRDSLLVSKTLTDFARRGHTKSAEDAKN